jgi:hypothetical protein
LWSHHNLSRFLFHRCDLHCRQYPLEAVEYALPVDLGNVLAGVAGGLDSQRELVAGTVLEGVIVLRIRLAGVIARCAFDL